MIVCSFKLMDYVSEAKAEILDGPDIYVDRLSTLVLTCRVDFGPRTPDYIIWRKEDRVRTIGEERSLDGKFNMQNLRSVHGEISRNFALNIFTKFVKFFDP